MRSLPIKCARNVGFVPDELAFLLRSSKKAPAVERAIPTTISIMELAPEFSAVADTAAESF